MHHKASLLANQQLQQPDSWEGHWWRPPMRYVDQKIVLERHLKCNIIFTPQKI